MGSGRASLCPLQASHQLTTCEPHLLFFFFLTTLGEPFLLWTHAKILDWVISTSWIFSIVRMSIVGKRNIQYKTDCIKFGHLLSGNPASLYELAVVVKRRGSAKARSHITPYQAAAFPPAQTQIPQPLWFTLVGHIVWGRLLMLMGVQIGCRWLLTGGRSTTDWRWEEADLPAGKSRAN